MKLKIKPAYVGLLLIGIMFLSTFTYTIIQGFTNNPSQSNTNVPTTNVIDYKLTASQQNILISNRMTIMTYQYNTTCAYCQQQKQFLQQLTTNSKLSNQLFLELIASGNELPTLTLTSYYGQTELTNATQAEIISALCQVLITKPVECALQQIQ